MSIDYSWVVLSSNSIWLAKHFQVVGIRWRWWLSNLHASLSLVCRILGCYLDSDRTLTKVNSSTINFIYRVRDTITWVLLVFLTEWTQISHQKTSSRATSRVLHNKMHACHTFIHFEATNHLSWKLAKFEDLSIFRIHLLTTRTWETPPNNITPNAPPTIGVPIKGYKSLQ